MKIWQIHSKNYECWHEQTYWNKGNSKWKNKSEKSCSENKEAEKICKNQKCTYACICKKPDNKKKNKNNSWDIGRNVSELREFIKNSEKNNPFCAFLEFLEKICRFFYFFKRRFFRNFICENLFWRTNFCKNISNILMCRIRNFRNFFKNSFVNIIKNIGGKMNCRTDTALQRKMVRRC